MSILLLDGMDHYGNGTDLGYAGYTVAGTPAFVTGRYGRGFAVSLPADADSINMAFTASAEVYAGFSFKMTAKSDDNVSIAGLIETASAQLYLTILPSGLLALYRDTAFLASANAKGVLLPNNSYYLELHAVINNTTGAYDVWVDGVSVMSATSVDTQSTATAQVDSITLFGSTDLDPRYDDIYVVDTGGAAPLNTRLKEIEVDTLHPNAAGSNTGWTPNTGANYAAVDEVTPDNDTTYVEAGATSDTDHYNFDNMTLSYDTVLAVQVKSLAFGTGNLQNQVVVSATESVGSTHALGGTYAYYRDLFLTDPNTALAWTSAGVDSMEAGVEVVA